MNKVTIIGNMGRDAEIRSMQNGDKVANISVGCSERWKDKDGNRQERTEWIRVVVFGKLAEIVESYTRKGSKIAVVGKMQTRKWQDSHGTDRYTTEVVVSGFGGEIELLDSKPREDNSDGYGDAGNDYGSLDLDDDIPF